jgi:hypothetical protein
MPDAANDEHNTAGEASAQQENIASSPEHETSKPTQPSEAPQQDTSGNRQQTKPKQSFPKKGKYTNAPFKVEVL